MSSHHKLRYGICASCDVNKLTESQKKLIIETNRETEMDIGEKNGNNG